MSFKLVRKIGGGICITSFFLMGLSFAAYAACKQYPTAPKQPSPDHSQPIVFKSSYVNNMPQQTIIPPRFFDPSLYSSAGLYFTPPGGDFIHPVSGEDFCIDTTPHLITLKPINPTWHDASGNPLPLSSKLTLIYFHKPEVPCIPGTDLSDSGPALGRVSFKYSDRKKEVKLSAVPDTSKRIWVYGDYGNEIRRNQWCYQKSTNSIIFNPVDFSTKNGVQLFPYSMIHIGYTPKE